VINSDLRAKAKAAAEISLGLTELAVEVHVEIRRITDNATTFGLANRHRKKIYGEVTPECSHRMTTRYLHLLKHRVPVEDHHPKIGKGDHSQVVRVMLKVTGEIARLVGK
jgi:hypothetical protein